jgi:hypothetical protein
MAKNRKRVNTKLLQTLGEEINALPRFMQEILVDVLVIAFENIAVLSKAKSNVEFAVKVGSKVAQ